MTPIPRSTALILFLLTGKKTIAEIAAHLGVNRNAAYHQVYAVRKSGVEIITRMKPGNPTTYEIQPPAGGPTVKQSLTTQNQLSGKTG